MHRRLVIAINNMLNQLIPNKFVIAKEQLTLLLTINKTVLSEYKIYYYIRTCACREEHVHL